MCNAFKLALGLGLVMAASSTQMRAGRQATASSADYYDGAPNGNYEEYVFAMEWQPQWSQPPYCDLDIATILASSSYASNHLSVHGLWPNYNSSLHNGQSWPQYCVRSDSEDFTSCEHDSYSDSYCSPSDATLAKFNTTEYWQSYALQYAFGTSDLATHEWSKHGSCTLWSSEEYFTQINAMYDRLKDGAGATFLTANVGTVVDYNDLKAAFTKDTNGNPDAISFNCESCSLSEVWTAWAADPATLVPTTPIDIADTDACESCSNGVTIRAWDLGASCIAPAADDDAAVVDICADNTHGPPCSVDTDCDGVTDCVRCAGSGFCTNVPLAF